MKILNSLLIGLCFISSALMGDDSDPFKQQKNYAQDTILNDGAKNKYKISGEQILKGANIAGATLGLYALGLNYKSNTSCLFGFGTVLNIASVVIDAKEYPKISTGLGLYNTLWGVGNLAMFATSIVNIIDNGLTMQVIAWGCYYGAKSGVNLGDAFYRLYWAKKNQN